MSYSGFNIAANSTLFLQQQLSGLTTFEGWSTFRMSGCSVFSVEGFVQSQVEISSFLQKHYPNKVALCFALESFTCLSYRLRQ